MTEQELARFNMIEQQIRPWDVLDQGVLDLLEKVHREAFVQPAYRQLAYADIAVPLAHEQVMMHPKIEARMLQALDIHHTDSILEIGTGSGFVTALLACAGHHVTSVEIFEDLSSAAQDNLAIHGLSNVTLTVGDAARGWDDRALYDVIAITGSLPVLPEAFLNSLNRGGRLFVVLGQAPVMEAVLIKRNGPKEFSREVLFETELPALVNAEHPSQFVF